MTQQASPPDKTQDWYECHDASNDSKQQNFKLVSNPLTQIHSIERESKSEGLPDEIEKLRDIVALFAVAISCVGVASGGDFLETESRDACKFLA